MSVIIITRMASPDIGLLLCRVVDVIHRVGLCWYVSEAVPAAVLSMGLSAIRQFVILMFVE